MGGTAGDGQRTHTPRLPPTTGMLSSQPQLVWGVGHMLAEHDRRSVSWAGWGRLSQLCRALSVLNHLEQIL